MANIIKILPNKDMLNSTFYDEGDLVMISALQHYLFCPRRCALVHIEQQWQENKFTAEGRVLHERVHGGGREARKAMRIEFDVPIRSLRLGVIGRADIVEFHRKEEASGKVWQPFPVEYKRGRPKKDNVDKVQLCAQAICLEEMLHVEVPAGALFYGKNKRRSSIFFDAQLREETMQTASQVHVLLDRGITPPPYYTKGCESCSFLETCLPQISGKKASVARYLKSLKTS